MRSTLLILLILSACTATMVNAPNPCNYFCEGELIKTETLGHSMPYKYHYYCTTKNQSNVGRTVQIGKDRVLCV